MTSVRSRRTHARRRPYDVLFNAHDTNTSNLRETIARPAKGKRIRVLRVRAVQETTEGRFLYEVYFGEGANIDADPAKAVDTLDIPEGGGGVHPHLPAGRRPPGAAGRGVERKVGRDRAQRCPQDHRRIHGGELMPVRRRPYVLKVREVNSATNTRRQTLLMPSKGYRIRLVRVRVLQPEREGRQAVGALLRQRPEHRLRPEEGYRHPGRARRRVGLHPHLPEERGAARPAGRTPERPLARRGPLDAAPHHH